MLRLNTAGRLKSSRRPGAGVNAREAIAGVAVFLLALVAILAPRPTPPRSQRATGTRDAGIRLCLAGRHSEALPLLALAVSARPRDAWARYFRGLALAGMGRYREALADLVAAARLDPNLRPILPPVARLALRLGRWASPRLLALAWRISSRVGAACSRVC